MSGIVEVHEKMLAQLQQRNQQLQQEKAEVELKLRQVTALLSELQSLWMDLPPNIAASIGKVLSELNDRDHLDKKSARNSARGVKSTLTNGNNGKFKAGDDAEPQTPPPQRSNGWFSFSMNDVFGCTATPRGGKAVQAVNEVNPEHSPPQPERRPPPGSLKPLDGRSIAEEPDDAKIVRRLSKDSELSPSSDGTDCSAETPKFKISDEEKKSPVPSIPLYQLSKEESHSQHMVHFEEQTTTDESENHADNMVELLAEVPGATALIAEIDVLCNALQKQAVLAHRQLEQRIETLKSESREHRQQIEDSYLKTTAAQHEELELCKAKLAEITAELMPSNHIAGGIDLELCDEEWARCERIWEQRARVGQTHVDWLEQYFRQRLSATEAARDAIKVDFEQDLESVWQRKAVLTARFRQRLLNISGEEAKSAGHAQEIVSLRKDLSVLEKNAVMPLQTLADMCGRAEKEEITRLKAAVNDAKAQSKTATGHLTNFLEECKLDAESLKSSQNAELFAHAHLKHRTLLIVVFRGWLEQFFRVKLDARQQDHDKMQKEVASCQEKLQDVRQIRDRLEKQLEASLVSRGKAVDYVQSAVSQTAFLGIAFFIWMTAWLDSRLSAAKADLKTSDEEAASLRSRLSASEASLASGEKQLQRAQNFCNGDMLWLQNDKSRKQGILVAVFSAWNLKRLESQVQGFVSELELQKAECADSSSRIEPLQKAVEFAQRRARRRGILAAVYCSWVVQYLQHVARRALRRESELQRRTETKLETLRDTVMRLVDDYEVEGLDAATPLKRRSSKGSKSYSQASVASSVCSIADTSELYSDDDA